MDTSSLSGFNPCFTKPSTEYYGRLLNVTSNVAVPVGIYSVVRHVKRGATKILPSFYFILMNSTNLHLTANLIYIHSQKYILYVYCTISFVYERKPQTVNLKQIEWFKIGKAIKT